MALRRRRGPARSTSGLLAGFTDVVEIGGRATATVYRAREIDTGRPVALELLNVRAASLFADGLECELVALSSHPNIVTLYRTTRSPDGRPILVLELCAGAVSDRLRGGTGLPVPEVVSIGIKIAGALETGHRGGITHGEVTPQHILVTEFGQPVLADFGVATLQAPTRPAAGPVHAPAPHAAPELLEGGDASPATDVYGLASSLYELIAGRPAFRAHDGEPPAAVILRILRDPVRPLTAAGVPVQLSDLLLRALSKDPQARPPTAAAFAAELADVEIAQGWPRTPFPSRGPAAAGGWVPDEFDGEPAPAPAVYPVPPAVVAAEAPAAAPVPRWAVRTPPQVTPAAPQSVGDVAIDPASLPPKLTLRAGLSSVTVDDQELTVRHLLSRERLSWVEINGFAQRFRDGGPEQDGHGMLVAVTPAGAVALTATRRPGRELRELHALLEAYRIRGLQRLTA